MKILKLILTTIQNLRLFIIAIKDFYGNGRCYNLCFVMNYPNERYILQSELNKDIRQLLKSYIRIEHIFSYTYRYYYYYYYCYYYYYYCDYYLLYLKKKNFYLDVVSYGLYICNYSRILIIVLYLKPTDM